MGRITIFNAISSVIIGGIGAATGAPFGKEAMRWGMFIGGISGFIFPFYPLVIGTWMVERVRGRAKRQPEGTDDREP